MAVAAVLIVPIAALFLVLLAQMRANDAAARSRHDEMRAWMAPPIAGCAGMSIRALAHTLGWRVETTDELPTGAPPVIIREARVILCRGGVRFERDAREAIAICMLSDNGIPVTRESVRDLADSLASPVRRFPA